METVDRVVRFEPEDVSSRLSELRLPLERMRDVLEKAAGERANVTSSDPITTPGTEMWRWGTRFMRDDPVLRELGWIACHHGQIDGIRHDGLQMKLRDQYGRSHRNAGQATSELRR